MGITIYFSDTHFFLGFFVQFPTLPVPYFFFFLPIPFFLITKLSVYLGFLGFFMKLTRF